MIRDILKHADVIVIKVGSRVLLNEAGALSISHMTHLVEQLAHLHHKKYKVVFVSSGAIATGMQSLGLKKRPSMLAMKQAAAAIGQIKLMRIYEELFSKFDILVGQLLLTHEDFKDRKRHLNIKQTLEALLKNNVIPIINENDTVSIDEIKLGDNDVLASLVAMLLPAKALILLTTAPGFMITHQDGSQEKLSHIIELNEDLLKHIQAHKEGLSMGGMASKIKAAMNMIHVGGLAVIAPGHKPYVLEEIFSGHDIGTVIGKSSNQYYIPQKKRWILFYNKASGLLVIDDGAKKAIKEQGKSLLAVGVTKLDGCFTKGSVVEIVDTEGHLIAKGITNMGDDEILAFITQKDLVRFNIMEIIHRDNLALFP